MRTGANIQTTTSRATRKPTTSVRWILMQAHAHRGNWDCRKLIRYGRLAGVDIFAISVRSRRPNINYRRTLTRLGSKGV